MTFQYVEVMDGKHKGAMGDIIHLFLYAEHRYAAIACDDGELIWVKREWLQNRIRQ